MSACACDSVSASGMPSVCFCSYYLLLFVFVSPTLTPTRPAETVVPQLLDFALKKEGKERKHDGTEEALNRGGIEEATTRQPTTLTRARLVTATAADSGTSR